MFVLRFHLVFFFFFLSSVPKTLGDLELSVWQSIYLGICVVIQGDVFHAATN